MGVSSPMSKTRPKQGSDKKWQACSNVSKTIEKQGIEGRLGYCTNGPLGVSSPMSKTRSKLGNEGKLGDFSRSKESREVWNIVPMGQ